MSSKRYTMYESPNELLNDWRLRTVASKEIIEKSQNCIRTGPSAHPPPPPPLQKQISSISSQNMKRHQSPPLLSSFAFNISRNVLQRVVSSFPYQHLVTSFSWFVAHFRLPGFIYEFNRKKCLPRFSLKTTLISDNFQLSWTLLS